MGGTVQDRPIPQEHGPQVCGWQSEIEAVLATVDRRSKEAAKANNSAQLFADVQLLISHIKTAEHRGYGGIVTCGASAVYWFGNAAYPRYYCKKHGDIILARQKKARGVDQARNARRNR